VGQINDLRDEALRIATEHGFKDASVGEDIALMHSELSEALEAYRHDPRPNFTYFGIFGYHDKPEGIPTELADCVIRILHFCGKHHIDIEKAILEKMSYNDKRPFKHGNKTI
jgi:NTP pyrophosphatase (non-canonical NTP hydrolase)